MLSSHGGVTHGWIPPMEAFQCTVQGLGTLWPWHRVLPARLCLLEVPDQSCRLPLQNGAGAAATPRLFPSLPTFPLSSQPPGSVRAFWPLLGVDYRDLSPLAWIIPERLMGAGLNAAAVPLLIEAELPGLALLNPLADCAIFTPWNN